jgi:hypothetical protein
MLLDEPTREFPSEDAFGGRAGHSGPVSGTQSSSANASTQGRDPIETTPRQVRHVEVVREGSEEEEIIMVPSK